MRISLGLAAFTVVADMGYRWSQGKAPGAKTLLSWGILFIVMGWVSLSQFTTIVDIFSYMIIAIILLNNGAELAGKL